MNKRLIGKEAENFAINYLLKENYKILEKNFFSKFGEIDVIAEKDNTIVFIEVKYRKNSNYGLPYESINNIKKDRIIKTANLYLNNNLDKNIRFDLISILNNKIEHFKNIFD
ncbi:MAG: UPF0102 protein [Candidatus Sericytochromatia bacterium]|nr:MAG: UPF0102 protein [Candidatus Sericytochromatia bacterium]